MASYQKHYDDQGRKVDEYGNVEKQTDEYGNPVHAASVTYVATRTAAGGYSDDTNKHHGITGGYNDDTNRHHGTTGVYGIDTDRQQHGTTGGYAGDTGRQHGNIGGPYYGTNTADTGTGPRSGTTGGTGYGGTGGTDYGTTGGTGYGSGTGYGVNTGGAHTEAGYRKEHRQHDQSHGDQNEKKGIMDKIKEKLPGGHSDK
ncbi:hypothetical protein GYH30_025475 [Glycine max]|nr:hypothetical protein GYH30_025475 [Glycine max]